MGLGRFITFEGPDGSGKTTQVARLAAACAELDLPCVQTREPGGTALSETIRDLVLDVNSGPMSPVAEALLYAAARAQHVEEVIRPALEQGMLVLCDRFLDSSIAYQGYGRQLGEGVAVINAFAVQGCLPDLTFFLDLSPQEGLDRIGARTRGDRLEREDLAFHQRVYRGYENLAERYADRYVRLDGSKSEEDLASEILAIFHKRLVCWRQEEPLA